MNDTVKKPPAHDVLLNHVHLVHDYLDDPDSGGGRYDTGLNVVAEVSCCCLAQMDLPGETRTSVLKALQDCLSFQIAEEDYRVLGFISLLQATIQSIENNRPLGCDH